MGAQNLGQRVWTLVVRHGLMVQVQRPRLHLQAHEAAQLLTACRLELVVVGHIAGQVGLRRERRYRWGQVVRR